MEVDTIVKKYLEESFTKNKRSVASESKEFYYGIFESPTKKIKTHNGGDLQTRTDEEQAFQDKLNFDLTNAIQTSNNPSEGLKSIFDIIAKESYPSEYVISLFGFLKSSIMDADKLSSIPSTYIYEQAAILLDIKKPQLWTQILNFILDILKEEKQRIFIPNHIAINFVKVVLKQINTLPTVVDETQRSCVEKGKELLDQMLPLSGEKVSGSLSYYELIQQLPDIYSNFVQGNYVKNVHWLVEPLINALSKRRRQLAFILVPPDASWPLISQFSRSHEYTHVTNQPHCTIFQHDFDEFIGSNFATSTYSHLRDLLFQRSSIEDLRGILTQQGHSTDRNFIRKAIVDKIRDLVIRAREISHFDEPKQGVDSTQSSGSEVDVIVPENIDFWECMIEVADQLYSLVSSDLVGFDDLLSDFSQIVRPDDALDIDSDKIPKDNSLLWLLLQLFHIERLGGNLIARDFANDETYLSQMVKLYNEKQVLSQDGFYLRDLSLPCALSHQQSHLRDRSNLKYRHPNLTSAMSYATVCYHLQTYFASHYKANITKHDVFRNLTLHEINKVALVSQLRQHIVPNTLYVYLVPNKSDTGTLGFPQNTYLKGGILGYKLLDFININGKQRLLQLIYKMMLDSEAGPRFQDGSGQANCVSPYVLDVVYKLLHSAPCSAELMMREIFERLKRCDKAMKTHAEGGPSLSDHTLRWQSTMLQLLNFRLPRFLKYSSIVLNLVHCVKHSLTSTEHHHIYHILESFSLNLILIQSNLDIIQTLSDSTRDKDVWFPESEITARTMVMTIARIIRLRGLDDISQEKLHSALKSLHGKPLTWSEKTLAYFPDSVRSFYQSQTEIEETSVNSEQVSKMIQECSAHALFTTGEINSQNEDGLLEYYSKKENQLQFLCVLWNIFQDKALDSTFVEHIRRIALKFPLCETAENVFHLIDYILKENQDVENLQKACETLTSFIWTYQLVSFEHVIFALTRGHSNTTQLNFKLLEKVLVESTEFDERLSFWISLEFNPRYWVEDDFHEKLTKYLDKFPEYFEYEAFAMNGYVSNKEELKPALSTPMPIYYDNLILRVIPFLDITIGKLIEFEQSDLLKLVLDKFQKLYRYHQTPLAFIRDTLQNYYRSGALKDPEIAKLLVKLADFQQYQFSEEFKQYVDQDIPPLMFDSNYFEKILTKLAEAMSPEKCDFKSDSDLPERHFREFSNPSLQALMTVSIEILACPLPARTIVELFHSLIMGNSGKSDGYPSVVLHALGLLLASLPHEEFVTVVFEELLVLLKADSYLLERSEVSIPPRASSSMTFVKLNDSFSESGIQMSTSASRNFTLPYIFNNYMFNYHNFTINGPNTFLTLFQSMIHYSSIDIFETMHQCLMSLRGGQVTSDTQMLYICALVGPSLFRLEKSPRLLHQILMDLMYILQDLSSVLTVPDNASTRALEQIYDFLYPF
ncbi:hypothetical protein K7432_004332 [Basidiobolus ranarum]|uniref:Mediator of RNA polymerase II transcription subunit 23 n=1 Tax=Basidiobolus ranarum TaxID=34480 RepID=A0ABR2W4T3_9FUNG